MEDARAAQERDADRLRERLRGLGKLSQGPRVAANGEANGTLEGTMHDEAGSVDEAGSTSGGGGGRDELIEGAEVKSFLFSWDE